MILDINIIVVIESTINFSTNAPNKVFGIFALSQHEGNAYEIQVWPMVADPVPVMIPRRPNLQ